MHRVPHPLAVGSDSIARPLQHPQQLPRTKHPIPLCRTDLTQYPGPDQFSNPALHRVELFSRAAPVLEQLERDARTTICLLNERSRRMNYVMVRIAIDAADTLRYGQT